MNFIIPSFEEFLITLSFLLIFFMLLYWSYYGLKAAGYFKEGKK